MGRFDEICKLKYPVRIYWIDEGDGRGYYFAYLPDWGYSTVSATADTQKEALEELEEMKRNMVQYFLDSEKSIPEVSSAPFDGEQLLKSKRINRMFKNEVYWFRGFYIPSYMMESLLSYIEDRHHVGGFLEAVICNNLKGAVDYADDINLKNLPAYVGYLYNEAPSHCWGSKAIMEEWLSW